MRAATTGQVRPSGLKDGCLLARRRFKNAADPHLAVWGRTSACPPAGRPVAALGDLCRVAGLRTAPCRDQRGAAAEV
jgi:hypothetical protein